MTTKDDRSLGLIRQQRDSYQKEGELFNDLLQALVESSNEEIRRLLRLVRQGYSVDTIKLRLKDYLTECRYPEPRYLSEQRERALRITRLADSPPYRAPCHPWTSVINDDHLVSHLISIWLTWDNVWYTWVEKDLFLEALQKGRTPSHYCSPFLVNAILAWSCPYSNWDEVRSREGNLSDLMKDFLDEARRLFEQDTLESVDLPTVQGLAFLSLALALSGQDRLGYYYLLKLVGLCEDLEIAPPSSRDSEEQHTLSRATDITCWGIFNIVTASMLSWMKPKAMNIPRRSRPDVTVSKWTPYLLYDETYEDPTGALFRVHCDLSVLGTEQAQVLFSDDVVDQDQVAKVVKLHQQILELLSAIPECLRATKAAPSSVLIHHLWYQVAILRNLLWLAKNCMDCATQDHARSMANDAALRTAELCKIHADRYGYAYICHVAVQCVGLALYTLLDAEDNAQYGASVLELFLALRVLSRRSPIMVGILRMAQHYAQSLKYTLPANVQHLLADFESHEWNNRHIRKLVSTYPQPAVATSQRIQSAEPRDMGRFLEKLEGLTLSAQ